MKKKASGSKGKMGGRTSGVLWTYPTTVRIPIGEMPFTLTYGSEAVIHMEVGVPTYRVQHFDLGSNVERLKEQLDLLAERRQEAEVQMASNKRKAEHYFNKHIKPRSFKVGDLVLKQTGGMTQEEGKKLGPRWEGLYVVTAS